MFIYNIVFTDHYLAHRSIIFAFDSVFSFKLIFDSNIHKYKNNSFLSVVAEPEKSVTYFHHCSDY